MNDGEALVKDYLEIRKMREELKAKYDSQDSDLKDAIEEIEAAMLAVCNETNMNGFRTSNGTVTRTVKERFFCTDWDHFKEFINQEDRRVIPAKYSSRQGHGFGSRGSFIKH